MVSSALVDLSQISVLCVDDDPVMRTVVRAAMQQRGCRDIVQATDGQEALDFCAGRRFDLIICDLHMAPMDGQTLLRELGERGLAAGRAVIMLSADHDPAVVAAMQGLGVGAWLAKPISAHKLVERVAAVLGLVAPLTADATSAAHGEEAERHHTKLLADVVVLEELLGSLPYRERERPATWRAMRRLLQGMAAIAGTFGYGLIAELARRGDELLRAAEAHEAAAATHHAAVSQGAATIVTAIKRVVQNRLHGDGGEPGLRLLGRLDDFLAPLRARLEKPEKDSPSP
jgi:two-component system chemotaxis response regulator CheY